MENIEAFIEDLDWNGYKALWSKFWIQELGFDPHEKGFAKVAVKLPIEEARIKDKILEEKFVSSVKTNFIA